MRTPRTIEAVTEANGDTIGLTAADSAREFAPSCTVVICTRDRPVQLDQCLEAVSHLAYPDFDVLVVDNASGDSRTREVAAHWGVRYIQEPTVGLSRARNRGIRECDTEVVAFLDDDAIPDPQCLSGLAREFEDPQVMAVVGGRRALREETEAERLCASLEGSNCYGQERLVVDRQSPSWFERANFGGIGDGGNMAFRRRAIDLWPGFDERLGRGAILHGGEEHHAFFSLIERGYRVVSTPQSIVRHPYPPTLQDLRKRHLSDLTSSTGYFTLLLMEKPEYRRAVVRYVIEGLRAKPRWWRSQATTPRPRLAPRWRMLLACLFGPFHYFRSRLRYSPSVDVINSSHRLNGLGVWQGPAIESPADGSESL